MSRVEKLIIRLAMAGRANGNPDLLPPEWIDDADALADLAELLEFQAVWAEIVDRVLYVLSGEEDWPDKMPRLAERTFLAERMFVAVRRAFEDIDAGRPW